MCNFKCISANIIPLSVVMLICVKGGQGSCAFIITEISASFWPLFTKSLITFNSDHEMIRAKMYLKANKCPFLMIYHPDSSTMTISVPLIVSLKYLLIFVLTQVCEGTVCTRTHTQWSWLLLGSVLYQWSEPSILTFQSLNRQRALCMCKKDGPERLV